jgi:hypothetical protein
VSTYIKDEAAARVAALRYNTEGTYAAVSRATGLAAASLSAWHRRLHAPRPTSLAALREFTDADEELIPFTSELFGPSAIGARSGKLFGRIAKVFS